MQVRSFFKPALAGLGLLALGSCGEGGIDGSSFQSQYVVARNALEAGQYDKAKRSYARLMQRAGPLLPRLQLEYAHSELRSGGYEQAAQIAGALAQGSQGNERGAALSVLGTAQHEIGLALLQKGEIDAGKQQLEAARTSLAEVIKKYPDLDPLGSMSGRKASIDARLKRL